MMGLVCGSLMRAGSLKRFVLASALGGAIMVGGYAIFEALAFTPYQAIASIPFNCIQWAGGVIAAIALFPAVKAAEKSLRKG
jgi:uncharacterized membrane protein